MPLHQDHLHSIPSPPANNLSMPSPSSPPRRKGWNLSAAVDLEATNHGGRHHEFADFLRAVSLLHSRRGVGSVAYAVPATGVSHPITRAVGSRGSGMPEPVASPREQRI